MSPISALILDRDGTVIAMVKNAKGQQDSARFPEEFELFPNLKNLLKRFENVPTFLVTNQPGIAKGNFTLDQYRSTEKALNELMKKNGIPIRETFACLHHPVGTDRGDAEYIRDCDCRKPKPGLLLEIAKKYEVDLSKAWMIGDSPADEGAAKAAGVGKFVAVRTFFSEKIARVDRVYGFQNAPDLATALPPMDSHRIS